MHLRLSRCTGDSEVVGDRCRGESSHGAQQVVLYTAGWTGGGWACCVLYMYVQPTNQAFWTGSLTCLIEQEMWPSLYWIFNLLKGARDMAKFVLGLKIA
jgi:hypothetical protein